MSSDKAPHGAVIVYSEYKNGVERPGHIEVYDGKEFFYSDFRANNCYVNPKGNPDKSKITMEYKSINEETGQADGRVNRKVIDIWIKA